MKQFLFRLLATLVVGTVLAAPAVMKWWSPAFPVADPVTTSAGKADPALIRKLSDSAAMPRRLPRDTVI